MNYRLGFLLLLFLASCRKDKEIIDHTTYHLIAVAGQSNTHYGDGFDSFLDSPHPDIWQLSREDETNLNIIAAVQPLDHHTKKDSAIGFAMTFSKLYLNAYVAKGDKVLILPAGKAGSSFKSNKWNAGDPLYEDLVTRIKYVMEAYPNTVLKAILWHQGESDVNNSNYKSDLDAFITEIRSEVADQKLPFILGGLVPYMVQTSVGYEAIQEIISTTPQRQENTGYANPMVPFEIQKAQDSVNSLHYNADGLRELGKRYFSEYKMLAN